MSKRLVLATIASIVFCVLSYNISHALYDQSNSQSWAIILGIGEYENLDVDTRYADDDAEDIYQQLEFYWGSDNIKLLVDSDVVKKTVEDTILGWLAPKENENDVVMIFVAGHGDCEHIRLYDSSVGSNVTDIHYSEFASWLDILDSKKIILILDTCGSGSFTKGLCENGRVILTCGTNCEKCWQEETYEHGVFSYYLIQAFREINFVDSNLDGVICAEELFEYVKSEVTKELLKYPPPSPQHPYICDNCEGHLPLFKLVNDNELRYASPTLSPNDMAFQTERTQQNTESYRYLYPVVFSLVVLSGIAAIVVFKRKCQI